MSFYISNIVVARNGTAEIFVTTDMSEDSIYNWIDRCYVDRHYFTGWDLNDNGFMLNFDISLDCDVSAFATEEKYQSYIEKSIKQLVPIKWYQVYSEMAEEAA